MTRSLRTTAKVRWLLAAGVVLSLPTPGIAQAVTGALLDDLTEAQAKVTALAEAIPEEAYGWRPDEGVRSVSEVFLHLADASYVILTRVGARRPEDPLASLGAEVDPPVDKATLVAALDISFSFATEVVRATGDEDLLSQAPRTIPGRRVLDELLLLNTHTHEHLGQLIAYARSLDVVPPWSR
jgi:uncharacterized damage-inducible protein DinB